MRSSEVRGYYDCLLRGIEAPPREKASFYARLLRGGSLAIADQQREHVEDKALPLRDAEAVDEGEGDGSADAGSHASGDECSEAVASDEAVGVGSGGGGGDGSGAHGSHVSDYDGSSSVSSSSSSVEDVVDEDVVQDASDDDDEAWPDELDGAVLAQEDRPGEYHRLIMYCTWHAGCRKKRNTGWRQRQHFGRAEVLGFFSVWHAAGQTLSRRQHKKMVPKLAAIEAWVRRDE